MQCQKTIEHITNWLESYRVRAHQSGFVIGVSGGIDSAVTSTLCALTKAPVLALNMPIHQKLDQVSRSNEHIDWLTSKFDNVSAITVDLTSTFDQFVDATGANLHDHHLNDETTKLSLANSRSRLRMSALYYYAAVHRFLVAGTGNKVEDFGVGFFTKYGDGGVDISPIADLYKSEVFMLAKELNIIQSIQQAQPTDGLWDDDRTDEDQMGATYAELEWAMETDKNKPDTTLTARQEEVLNIFNKLHSATLHKISPIPICNIPKELLE